MYAQKLQARIIILTYLKNSLLARLYAITYFPPKPLITMCSLEHFFGKLITITRNSYTLLSFRFCINLPIA